MSGKIIYLPVATLPPEEVKLPEDPLAGCALMTDVRPHHHRFAVVPLPLRRGGLALAVIAGAAYVAACVIWPVALWAAPALITLGVMTYGSYYF